MKSTKKLLSIALTLFVAGQLHAPAEAWASPPGKNIVAIKKVNVVGTAPGQKRLSRKRTVIVEDGLIVEVGKAKKVEIPANATVIDGRKKYLLPGLADMHVHLYFLRSLPDMTPEDAYTLLLANGITTIHDMAGFDELFAWRRDLDNGKVIGPRLFFTSPMVRDDTVTGVVDAENRVRDWVARGYESIKIHTPIDEAVFRRVSEVARELVVPVVGHAARPGIAFSVSLDEGMRMIAHAEELLWVQDFESVSDLDAAIAGVAQNVGALVSSDAFLTTTVVVEDVFTKTAGDATFAEQLASPLLAYFPPSLRRAWEFDNPNRSGAAPVSIHQKVLDSHLATVREMKRLAATDRILVGTDGGGPDLVLLGFSIRDELALLVKAGLSPREVIRAATYSPAVFLGTDAVAGSVEAGKQADLLLVDRNPLKRIQRLQEISGVMVRGHWLGADQLDERLAKLAAKFE